MISKFRSISLLGLFALLLGVSYSGKTYAQLTPGYAGAQLYVDYAGKNDSDYTYRIYLVTYTLCVNGSTTAVPLTENVGINMQCDNKFCITKKLPQVIGTDTVSQLCTNATSLSSCASSTAAYSAYQVTVYSDTVKLTEVPNCNLWPYTTFTWEPSSTLSRIPSTSLSGTPPMGVSVNIYNGITNNYRANISSPRYSYPAAPQYMCQNMNDQFETSPTSPESDSLVTSNSIMHAYKSGSCGSVYAISSAYYDSGYSSGAPFSTSTSYTVSGATGVASFKPPALGTFFVDFVTSAYDNYTQHLLATCEQVIAVPVVNCDTTYPSPYIDSTPRSLSGGVLTGSDTITICPKTLLSFTIVGFDTASSLYHIVMTSNNKSAIPGSVFTPSPAGDSVWGTFSWTPTGSDIGFHTVTFSALDSSCFSPNSDPIVLNSTTTMVIHVLSSIYAGKLNNYCGTTSDSAQLYVVGPPSSTYVWSDITTYASPPAYMDNPYSDSPKVAPPYNYCYSVTLNTSIYNVACAQTDTVCVGRDSPTAFTVVASPATICKNQSTILSYTASPKGFVLSQDWFPPTSLDNPDSPSTRAHPLVTTNYILHVKDVDTCSYHIPGATVTVNGVAPLLHAYASPRDTVCPNGTVQLNVNASTQTCQLDSVDVCIGPDSLRNMDIGHAAAPSALSGTAQPSPIYYYCYYPQRMQILYKASALRTAGVQPGLLKSLSFFIASATSSTDTEYGYTIKIACTQDNTLSSGAFADYSFSQVYGPTNRVFNKTGKTTFSFAKPYYWDGTSNVVVEICFGTNYENYDYGVGSAYVVSEDYNAVKWSYQGDDICCTAGVRSACGFQGSNSLSNYRPETEWDNCPTTSFTYKWTENPAPPFNLNNTTIPNPVASDIRNNATYKVTVASATNPGCTNTDSVYIVQDTSVSVVADPHNITVCRPGYVSLSAIGRGPRALLNAVCGPDNPVKCTKQDTIDAFGIPYVAYSYSIYYDGPPFYNPDGRTQFIITAHDLLNSGMKPGTLNQIDFYIDPNASSSNLPVAQSLSIYIGCTSKQGFKSGSDFIRGLTEVYSTGAYTFTPGENSFVFNRSTYNWDTTQNLVVQICYDASAYNYFEAGVTMTNTSYNSMIYNYNYSGSSVCGGGGNSDGTYQNRPSVSFEECDNIQDSVFHYTWYPGDYLSDSTVQSPTAYVSNSVKYYVSTKGRNQCPVSDSVNIYVPSDHYSVYPIDTAVCQGTNVQLNATGASSYHWYQNGFQPATSLSCDNCSNPVATANDTTTYQIVFTDAAGCSDTLYDRVDIKPIPNVKVVTPDTTIELDGSIQLFATGAFIYNWWPASTLSNPNIVNPVASPKSTTTYTVTGIGLDGCVASDSVTIKLGYHATVTVPSAFTPNGDGKNDVFHVANMTSEKVIEFRVFNRWGQEIFNATDNRGWDGTWNGVPQDIGAYDYLIRVTFLDGKIQTFKGSVTLIR